MKAEYNERNLKLKIGKREQPCFTIHKAVKLAQKEKCEELKVVGKKEVRVIDLRYTQK